MKKFTTLLGLLALLTGCSPTWQSSNTVGSTGVAQQRQVVADSNPASSDVTTDLKVTNANVAPSGPSVRDEVYLIVYRKSGFVGSATSWPIQYNGVKIGALKNGSFIAIKTNAGVKKFLPESHLGIYSEGVEAFSINAQPGKTYYLEHGPDSIYTSKVKIREVEANIAKTKIAKYSMVTVVDEYQTTRSDVKGKVIFVSGRAFVERGIKTYPVKVGTAVFVGDKINVEEGSRVSLLLHGSGRLEITEKTSFQIPETQTAASSAAQSAPAGIVSSVWNKVKTLLKGESFEIKTPTAVAGVRG